MIIQARMTGWCSVAKLINISTQNIITRQHIASGLLQCHKPLLPCIITKKLTTFPRTCSVQNSPLCNGFEVNNILSSSESYMGLNRIICHRGYAKKVSKTKKGVQVKAKVEMSEDELQEVIDFPKMRGEMESALKQLHELFSTQLSLRSNAGVFDSLQVDTPDGVFQLIEVAQIVQKNPSLVLVDVSAIPQYTAHVKEALTRSSMNLNPQQEGTTFFIPIPKVTRDHRESLAKGAKTLSDKTKEKLRKVQNNYLKTMKKGKSGHSTELLHNVEELVMVTTKNYAIKVDQMKEAKEKEILQK